MLIVPVNIKINGILIFLWHLNFYATPYVRYVADKCLLKIKNVNYLNLLNVVPNVFKVNNQFSLDFPYVFLIYLTRFLSASGITYICSQTTTNDFYCRESWHQSFTSLCNSLQNDLKSSNRKNSAKAMRAFITKRENKFATELQ